ncbi:IclR family transcriptional regulator [Halococcus agarilyticus]|uniref:IclR family transcriptional regulator n=1 Tax=Halococcus agarilyticus TaxID=1232219 RepID=UPI00067766FE|nr:IclR family transcriptional regulator [Halococcus agarilyticus]
MSKQTKGNEAGKRQVASVANACDIIDLLYEQDGARVSEIAEALGLNKGTVHTQLSTLKERGYVHMRGKVYHPSMRFLEIGEGVKTQIEVFKAARDELHQLAEQTDEYAHLMIEQNGWGYIIHKEKGDKAATTTSRAGKKLHLHYTSTGKAILAHLPDERVREIIDLRGLPERTEKTITDYESLQSELAEIRKTGVSYDRGEQINGARCVGAPVLEPDGTVLGGISVSGPVSRMSGDFYQEELPDLVSSTANIIELNIEVDRLDS